MPSSKSRSLIRSRAPSLELYISLLLKDRSAANDLVDALDALSPDNDTRPSIQIYREATEFWLDGVKNRSESESWALLVLRFILNRSVEDVSTILNIDEGDVDSLVRIARRQFQREISASVLIIEDEPVIASDIGNIVWEGGHSVAGIASTYKEALEIGKKTSPTLILADIALADGSSGVDAVRDLIAINPVPSIFVTAFPERLLVGDRPEPTFLVTKPFQPDTLRLAIIQSFLTYRRDSVFEGDAENRADEARWRRLAYQIGQQPLGAKFIPGDDVIKIDPAGDASDESAASDPTTVQLYEQVRRRVDRFRGLAARLDNQPGWEGIGSTADRLASILSNPISDMPAQISNVWAETVELGTFLELSRRVKEDKNVSDIAPLSAETIQRLESLIFVAAPWVRRFPTARKLDDESGSFLSRPQLFAVADSVIQAAGKSEIINSEDWLALRSLASAARRGEFQGKKAETRVVFSARNLAVAALLVFNFEVSAITDVYAEHSPFAKIVGRYLAEEERHLEELFMDAPADLRIAIGQISHDWQGEVAILPKDNEGFKGRGGWLYEVWACILRLNKIEFSLENLYESEDYLKVIYPKNYHIKDKIRQQLQILRDLGAVEFLGHGRYRLAEPNFDL